MSGREPQRFHVERRKGWPLLRPGPDGAVVMYADALAWVKRVQEEERDKAAREWADEFFDAQRKSYVAGRADALEGEAP